MITGWLFLGVGVAVTLVDLAIGLAWVRKTPDDMPRNADGSLGSAQQINRVGGIVLIVAPLFLAVFAAVAFGLIPIDAVEPIGLRS